MQALRFDNLIGSLLQLSSISHGVGPYILVWERQTWLGYRFKTAATSYLL